jgi:hypothetical protein
MNVTKVFGLAAVGALLAFAAPSQSALALSLVNPGAAAAVQESSKEVSGATEVHWRRHHHHRWHRHHHWRHRHHHHHHRHWHRW